MQSEEYIRDADIKALRHYQYHSVDKSLMTKYVLNPYWCWLVKHVPLWVAPNLITLTGFAFMVVSTGLLIKYGSNWEEVPHWVYFCWSLFLFFYQSLDAIDGKQARRTGSSGPLGELFDHGCDAINTTLAVLCALSALGIGQINPAFTVVAVTGALLNFYFSSWETYHTHTLFLSYFSGPVEGILAGCILFMITGFTGPDAWKGSLNDFLGTTYTSKAATSIPLFAYIGLGAGILVGFNLLCSIINVYNYTRGHGESLIKKLVGLLPQFFFTAFVYTWTYACPLLMENHLIPFFLFIGFAFGHQVGLIILNHVAKKPFPYWNRMYTLVVEAGLLFMACSTDFKGITSQFGINLPESLVMVQNYRDAIIDLLKGEGLNVLALQKNVLWGLVILGLWIYGEFAGYVINRLCDIFDINCLSIKHPKTIQTEGKISTNTTTTTLPEKTVYTMSVDGKKKKLSSSANQKVNASAALSPSLTARRRNRLQGF